MNKFIFFIGLVVLMVSVKADTTFFDQSAGLPQDSFIMATPPAPTPTPPPSGGGGGGTPSSGTQASSTTTLATVGFFNPGPFLQGLDGWMIGFELKNCKESLNRICLDENKVILPNAFWVMLLFLILGFYIYNYSNKNVGKLLVGIAFILAFLYFTPVTRIVVNV